MKNYKVIYTIDTKGKEAETVLLQADKFELIKEKGCRYFAFFWGVDIKAIFSADKITAIFEI